MGGEQDRDWLDRAGGGCVSADARHTPHTHATYPATAFSLPLGYRVGIVVGGDLSQLTRLLLASFPPDMPMAYPGTYAAGWRSE